MRVKFATTLGGYRVRVAPSQTSFRGMHVVELRQLGQRLVATDAIIAFRKVPADSNIIDG
jgi:hypothetical protein